eukprot:1658197-Prymnesium_polylepis.1
MSDGTFVCMTPAWAGLPTRVPLNLSLNGVDFAGRTPAPIFFSFYRQPTISAVWPRGGPVAGGTMLTLAGIGFDGLGRGAGALCMVGGELAVAATWTTAESALCVAPAAPGATAGDAILSLALNGDEFVPRCRCLRTCAQGGDGVCDDGGAGAATAQCASGTDCDDCGVRCDAPPSVSLAAFAYFEQPTLAQLQPSHGPVRGGHLVTVVALGLANHGTIADARCLFGTAVVHARMKSARALLCATPPGLAGPVAVRVAINGVDFTPSDGALSYRYACESYADAWSCVRDPACAACYAPGAAVAATERSTAAAAAVAIRQAAEPSTCVARAAVCSGRLQLERALDGLGSHNGSVLAGETHYLRLRLRLPASARVT